jgi:hypothetical protein
MRKRCLVGLAGVFLLGLGLAARAEVKTVVERNDNDHATAEFKFKTVPAPSKSDAGTKAKFTVVDGARDEAGGDLDKLNDGKLPTEADQPAENFFFNAGTEGGRLGIDLLGVANVKQVNTYSWHPGTRGPQVYKLYGADGTAAGFNAMPKNGTDPATVGWKLLANVDTKPKDGEGGGQYGVSISDSTGSLGKFRYLLMDVARTESDDAFGNTFFSEIDVVSDGGPVVPAAAGAAAGNAVLQTKVVGEGFECVIDTTDTPDLKDWADTKLKPVVEKWYPILVKDLPSDGYTAPKSFTITFRHDFRGVAATGGTRIMCAYDWFSKNLTTDERPKAEGLGAIVHEMVHVVQQYGRARRTNPNATRTPGWLIEAIPDYLRWYKYEPASHGADIPARRAATAKYDSPYRVGANFLNFVSEKYDKDLVKKLNAACREGKYEEGMWKTMTGKTAQELGDEWKAGLEKGDGVSK